MLALTYAGICQLVLLQFLAQTVLPYQVLCADMGGAERSRPPRRALSVLVVLLAATLAPIAIGEPDAEARDLAGRALLFAAIGLVPIASRGVCARPASRAPGAGAGRAPM